jgi:predicted AAA+ superfamily ATPase
VDFILEHKGKLIALEVKNAEKITDKDLAGIKEFRAVTGKDFYRGIILCNCKRIMQYDEGIYLVPLSALWSE